MKPTRLVLGIAMSIVAIGAFWPNTPEPTLELAPAAPNTVVITEPPTTTTIAATTTVAPTTTKPIPLLPPDHVCYDWLPTLLAAGWPKDPGVLATALTIVWRESRCQAWADSGPDHGGFQVNRYWCNPSKYTANGWLQDRGLVVDCDSLFDPLVNARSAYAIYLYSLEKNGDGFLPWTTYSAKSSG